MSLKPKKRILIVKPNKGQNPNHLSVYVADAEAREAVNSFRHEDWAKGESLFVDDRDPIRENNLHGRFIINPCYDIDEIIETIESAI